MKKIVGTMLSVIMLVLCVCSLAACLIPSNNLPTYEDMFSGTLSKDSYSTSEECVSAFVTNEICGKTTNATFVDYQKISDLTDSEKADLELTEEQRASLTAAEYAQVEYLIEEESSSREAKETSTQKVVLLLFGEDWHYYSPKLENGESITRAYYESVLGYEKFVNCTLKATSSATLSYDSYNSVTSTNIEAKMTAQAIYIKMIVRSGTSEQTMETYIVEDSENHCLKTYTKGTGDESFTMSELTEYETLKEYYSMGLELSGSTMDHSYFVKTKYGFELSPDKWMQFVDNALGDMSDATINFKELFCRYFVKDGRLIKNESKITIEVTNSGTNSSVQLHVLGEYSDFGTTTLTLPEGIE